MEYNEEFRFCSLTTKRSVWNHELKSRPSQGILTFRVRRTYVYLVLHSSVLYCALLRGVGRLLGCGRRNADPRPSSVVLVVVLAKVGSPLISKRVQKFISEPAATLTAPISIICSPLGGWHDPGRGFTTRLGCSTRVLAAAVDRAAGETYTRKLHEISAHTHVHGVCLWLSWLLYNNTLPAYNFLLDNGRSRIIFGKIILHGTLSGARRPCDRPPGSHHRPAASTPPLIVT